MNNRYREEEKESLESQVVEEEISNVDVVEEVSDSETIESLKNEVKRLNELYLRTLAESENFKKRINEERIRDRKYASQSLLEKLVETLDIFDKAVNYKPDDEKVKNFLIGFEMINNNFKQILADEGVKKINSIGEVFNPVYHHAVETAWEEDKEENIVLSETQSGYTYKDRVLRPSLVKVNKKNLNKSEE